MFWVSYIAEWTLVLKTKTSNVSLTKEHSLLRGMVTVQLFSSLTQLDSIDLLHTNNSIFYCLVVESIQVKLQTSSTMILPLGMVGIHWFDHKDKVGLRKYGIAEWLLPDVGDPPLRSQRHPLRRTSHRPSWRQSHRRTIGHGVGQLGGRRSDAQVPKRPKGQSRKEICK